MTIRTVSAGGKAYCTLFEHRYIHDVKYSPDNINRVNAGIFVCSFFHLKVLQ